MDHMVQHIQNNMKDYEKEYERLKKDTAEWCSINLINLGDRTKQAIGRKQWIVARLFDMKRDLMKLNKERKVLRDEAIVKYLADPDTPVSLDKATLMKLDNTIELEAINEQIKDCEFVIAYLEASVKMYTYIAQDIKNLLDAHKLQTEDY